MAHVRCFGNKGKRGRENLGLEQRKRKQAEDEGNKKSTNATDGHERERTDWKTDEPRLRARGSLNTTNAVPASHP
jgi:hypothetical protein